MSPEPGNHRATMKIGDDLELDIAAYELRRAGRVLRLERIPMEILLLLAEHRELLVSRQSIVERIWGTDTFLDTDNAINGAIRKIRRALRDDPDHPRFIQTVMGKGYRFIAPVVAGGVGEPIASRPAPTPAPPPARRGPVTSRRWPALLGAGILLALLVTYVQWSRPSSDSPRPEGRLMLAVFPFENLTGDAGQEYFSDGLTEEMINRLGNLDHRRLGVIARTSVMRYKHRQEPLARLGRELGVQYVLEGSVRRDAERVRIGAQLIQVKDETQLWTRQYDRELSSILAVQGEIAQAVADEIRLTLADAERNLAESRPLLSPETYEAYDLYLRGRYFWNKRTPAGLQQAVESFEQAIAVDPAYARAYAGLADSYALLSGYSLVPQEESIPKARAAALRALDLDERLPEAHTSLAVIVQNHDWDWETAELEFRRAIELDPNYATAHHWYAEHLALRGRFDEASTEIERARRLDPLSLIIATDGGAILYFSRQYDRAIQTFRAVLEMEPNFPRAYILVYAYVQVERFDDALAAIEQWRRVDDTPWIEAMQAYVHGRAGDQTSARRALDELRQRSRLKPLDPALLFVAHIGMGDTDEALVRLEEAYLQHSPALTALGVDPLYDPLRGDPRFQSLLRRLRLAS